jgi:2-keto-3-deoxy-L-rhamnonate aldolase RhmA
MVAMTDLSEALGYAFQYDHPEVWKALDSIVAKARARGIVVAANSGYAFTTADQVSERVRKLHEHGVRICLMQGADTLLENYSKSLLGNIRGSLAGS